MKKLYSLLTLAFLLLTVSGCEDDYRSMVLFSGTEPIYQIGTCDNLVSSVLFFLSEKKEIVLGIDGGDGAYNLVNDHESVARVTFTEDMNGYQRIRIQPLAVGEAVVRVTDGSGTGTQLRITVKARREFKMKKMAFEYGISADAPSELLNEVIKALDGRPWLENGGYYLLVPDVDNSSFAIGEGLLEIYPTGKEKTPLTGRYETVVADDEEGKTNTMWQFTCNGETRIYTRTFSGGGGAEAKCILLENVTPFCPEGLLPEGVMAVYREKFLLSE